MKKRLALLSAIMLFVTPCISHAEALETFSNEDGNISIVGFTTAENDGSTDFVVLLQYENTKTDSTSPEFLYSVKAYQDGIELEHAYIYNYSFEDYKDSDTNIRPGAVLNFYEIFKLESGSPVDVEVAPMFSFDNDHIEYTFDLSEEIIPVSSSDETNANSSTSTVAQKIAELEQRITELEQRVAELEQ